MQVTEYMLSLLLWPFKIYSLKYLLGHSLSLALTLWDTTDKEAGLFPQGGPFDKVSNGNN